MAKRELPARVIEHIKRDQISEQELIDTPFTTYELILITSYTRTSSFKKKLKRGTKIPTYGDLFF